MSNWEDIKKNNKFNSLYRFYPYNAHDLDSLSNNYLWFSSYADFNDPFEDVFIRNAIFKLSDFEYSDARAISFIKEFYKDEFDDAKLTELLTKLVVDKNLESYFKEKLNRLVETTQRLLDEYIEINKACCFATDDLNGNKKALENKLMWSHYSNGFRGFCIEYDFDLLIDSISRFTDQAVGLSPIIYSNLSKHHVTDLALQTGSIKLDFGSLICMKSNEWAYENEYRLLLSNMPNLNYFSSKSIKSITVGEKMPENKLNTLVSILKSNPDISCKLNKAYIDPDDFNIKIVEHSTIN
ncbi:DUF2971 domain-containing protein [Photobacterium angustum]|uniref:DUF2971 domain-containing protein n=1 Tax=Photobacterium angustum TaxID=661 RepID=UPI0005EB607D|nr:DUF2971 domain-containing protein [Photobacterium angustum]PSV91640.1 DUF2971 domain-containing protein [Photobacterium angustum]